MATATQLDHRVAQQWAKIDELDKAAHEAWEALDRAKVKLVKLAKMGRKVTTIVPISETRGIKIVNKFREKGAVKIFAPAFAKKFDFKEVPLD
jgi:uncharacterized coiled-coil protein SlyX